MASLRIFCTHYEFDSWQKAMMNRFDLVAAEFRDSEEYATIYNSDAPKLTHHDTYRIVLAPKTSTIPQPLEMNDVQARYWGWIDCRPGRLITEGERKTLLYSEIHGEDFDVEPVHPARFVKYIKRQIRKTAHVGVVAGEKQRRYNEIWYTDAAKALYDNGCEWKQYPTNNFDFHPGE